MDEPADDTESVLAAYRERKRQALESRGTGGNAGPPPAVASSGHLPVPSASAAGAAPSDPSPGPSHYHFAHPVPPQVTEIPDEGPSSLPPPIAAANLASTPAPVSGPSASPAPATGPVPSSRSLDTVRPTGLSSAPGATLSALGPVLRLSDALLKDTKVSIKGSPPVRAAGIVLILLGLVAVALDRRAIALGSPVPEYLLAGMGLLALGCLLFLIGMNFPRNRRLAVRLAANQREEWKRVQGESVRLVWMARTGLGLAILGLLVVAAGYMRLSIPVLYLGGAVTVAGLALLLVAQVRRGIARRLYVQTLVLSGLEASGLGGAAPDERVQPVILALDRLLGALPESEVQAFLATPQAQAYLQLVDEATRSQRGP